jgi:hypothetical protein
MTRWGGVEQKPAMTTHYRLEKRCEHLEAIARELRRPLELEQQRQDR